MRKVRIGGVPEHFNLAWYLTLKEGLYKEQNINLRWQDYHGGTGEMSAALRNDEIDIAVILTEGIVKEIIEGNPSRIVQTFVKSPLIWGIHVAKNSSFQTIESLKGSKAAISRLGSGSHLMAYLHAENQGWNLHKDLNFEIIGDLNGAIEALTGGMADYFLWEKFTTKPLVDNKTFRLLGQYPTPWPCFVIAASEKFIDESSEDLKTILNIINNCTTSFKQLPDIDKMISNRYEQQLQDVRQWLNLTEWSQSQIDEDILETVQNDLMDLKIIKKKLPYNQLIAHLH